MAQPIMSSFVKAINSEIGNIKYALLTMTPDTMASAELFLNERLADFKKLIHDNKVPLTEEEATKLAKEIAILQKLAAPCDQPFPDKINHTLMIAYREILVQTKEATPPPLSLFIEKNGEVCGKTSVVSMKIVTSTVTKSTMNTEAPYTTRSVTPILVTEPPASQQTKTVDTPNLTHKLTHRLSASIIDPVSFFLSGLNQNIQGISYFILNASISLGSWGLQALSSPKTAAPLPDKNTKYQEDDDIHSSIKGIMDFFEAHPDPVALEKNKQLEQLEQELKKRQETPVQSPTEKNDTDEKDDEHPRLLDDP
ncbi:MAG: hypothetical protein Q8R79_01900 [Legionellaceae bacterium]|nr:hypothetical protein [Legionellaceae bacterium]